MLGAKPNPKNAELRDELHRVEGRLQKCARAPGALCRTRTQHRAGPRLRPRVQAWEELGKEAAEEQSRVAAQRGKEGGEAEAEEEEEEDPILEPAHKMVLAACPRGVQEALESGEEQGAVVRGVWVPNFERAQAKVTPRGRGGEGVHVCAMSRGLTHRPRPPWIGVPQAAEVRAKAQSVRALCERLDAARRDAVEAYHGHAFPELGGGRGATGQSGTEGATPRGLLRAVARAGVNTQGVRQEASPPT